MKGVPVFFLVILISTSVFAQEVPYYEIPKPSETYTAGSVASRMIDGLGFRYYWATQGLTDKDLQFKPSEGARNTKETIAHLYDLSTMMLNITKTKIPQAKSKNKMSYIEMRTQTLLNFQGLSDRLKATKEISELDVKKDGKITIPFWNIINGPIADAIWHTGQIASFRRSSGNPINPKIDHFNGTVKE